MRYILALLIALPIFSYGQFRIVGNAGFTAVNDSTYIGTVTGKPDLTGFGYNAFDIQVNDVLFTAIEYQYLVDSVWDKTRTNATIRVREYDILSDSIRNQAYGKPYGQFSISRLNANKTIPQVPLAAIAATPQLNAAIDAHNARVVLTAAAVVIDSTRLNADGDTLFYYQNDSLLGFGTIRLGLWDESDRQVGTIYSLDKVAIGTDTVFSGTDFMVYDSTGTGIVEIAANSSVFLRLNEGVNVWDIINQSGSGDVFRIAKQGVYPAGKSFIIDTSYNVGINANPTELNNSNAALYVAGNKLQIDDSGNFGTLQLTNSQTGNGVNDGLFLYLDSVNAQILLANNEKINIGVNNTSQITVTDTAIGMYKSTPEFPLEIGTTKGVLLPEGTTLQRPTYVDDGLLRYNTDSSRFEYYSSDISDWIQLTDTSGYNSSVTFADDTLTIADGENIFKVDINSSPWEYVGNYIYTLNDSVGIGTATPTAALDVLGRIELRDAGSNTGIGQDALLSSGTGQFNIGIGYWALKEIESGGSNIAIGTQTMENTKGASWNVAIGISALNDISEGTGNVALGQNALGRLDTGLNNIVLGTDAGILSYETPQSGLSYDTDTLFNSVYLGYNIRGTRSGVNEIIIGANARGNGDSTATIGAGMKQLKVGNYIFNVDQDTTGKDGYVLAYDAATNEISLDTVATGATTDTSGYNLSLTFANDTLSLTDDNSTLKVELPQVADTDDQTLSIVNKDSIAISEGNQVELPIYYDYNESETYIGLLQNDEIMYIGQQVRYRVKNQTGSTIPKGALVGFAGTTGASGNILVSPFLADGSTSSRYVVGILTSDIADGGDGYAMKFGKLRPAATDSNYVGTEAWANGDVLWADPSNAGGLTKTEPEAPNLKLPVAAVVYADDNNGELLVRVNIGSSIFDANDAQIDTAALEDNQFLVWDETDQRWENGYVRVDSLTIFGEGTTANPLRVDTNYCLTLDYFSGIVDTSVALADPDTILRRISGNRVGGDMQTNWHVIDDELDSCNIMYLDVYVSQFTDPFSTGPYSFDLYYHNRETHPDSNMLITSFNAYNDSTIRVDVTDYTLYKPSALYLLTPPTAESGIKGWDKIIVDYTHVCQSGTTNPITFTGGQPLDEIFTSGYRDVTGFTIKAKTVDPAAGGGGYLPPVDNFDEIGEYILTESPIIVGPQALSTNLTGYNPEYFNLDGRMNIRYNISGTDNSIYLGFEAGRSSLGNADTLSNNNGIGIGFRTLGSITSGSIDNIALGRFGLNGLDTGAYNIGIGSFAGNTLYGGDDNIFIGHASGYQQGLTDANSNIAIGDSISLGSSTATNRIVIGGNITATSDNSAIIGNSQIETFKSGNYIFNVDQDTTGRNGQVLKYNAATGQIELDTVTGVSASGGGLNIYQQAFTEDGDSTYTVTEGTLPDSISNIFVFHNGLFVDESNISVAGSDVSLSYGPEIGDRIVIAWFEGSGGSGGLSSVSVDSLTIYGDGLTTPLYVDTTFMTTKRYVDSVAGTLGGGGGAIPVDTFVTIAGTETITGAKTFTEKIEVDKSSQGEYFRGGASTSGAFPLTFTSSTPSGGLNGEKHTINVSGFNAELVLSNDGNEVVTINKDNDMIVDDSTLYVDATNNRVGIGTSSPNGELDVNGLIRAGILEYDADYRSTVSTSKDGANYFEISAKGTGTGGTPAFSTIFSRGTHASPLVPEIGDRTFAIFNRVWDGDGYDVNPAAVTFYVDHVDTTASPREVGASIYFETGRTTAGARNKVLAVTSDGNVGIGTTSPNNKLQINSDSLFAVDDVNDRIYINGTLERSMLPTSRGKLEINGTTNEVAFRYNGGFINETNDYGSVTKSLAAINKRIQYLFYDRNNVQTGKFGVDVAGTDDDDFQIVAGSGSTPQFHLEANGNVGIGTTSPSAKLHTVGTTDGTALTIQDADGTCTTNPESASISFSCTSDQRVKTNIREAESVLPYIMGIPIKQYNLIDNYESHTGVIAQELLNNYPELVTMGQDSLYKVSTIPHWKIIKAIQEQQAIIESIQTELDAKSSIIETQATKIQNLESTIQTQQQQIQDLINRITAIENQ